MNLWTENGKPVPYPQGTARLSCFYCGHDEPGDLGFTFSYLESRFVPACADEWCCDMREAVTR